MTVKFRIIRNGHDEYRWQQKDWGWNTRTDLWGAPKKFYSVQAALDDIERHVKSLDVKTVYTLEVKI